MPMMMGELSPIIVVSYNCRGGGGGGGGGGGSWQNPAQGGESRTPATQDPQREEFELDLLSDFTPGDIDLT